MRIVLAICIVLGMICFPSVTIVHGEASAPEVSADAAILMDAKTGRILYAKQADKSMKIASLTKIMTAIVAIEQGKLTERVTVKPDAVGVEGSSIYLKQGEKIPLETLLYGLMLRSGNDAAVAIAEHIGGSVEGFVYLMNEKATQLGLTQTHFVNPHGLDHPKHYSSAKDLAVLTSYALKNPVFRRIVKTEVKEVPWPGETWRRTFYNKNKFLRLYKGADGVKTGFTKQSGRTLVTSATRKGKQLICVTLNDPNDWEDHRRLYEYGFSHYRLRSVLKKGEVVLAPFQQEKKRRDLTIVADTTFQYPLSKHEKEKIVLKPMLTYPPHLLQQADVHVGSVQIYLDQKRIGSVPLISKWRPTTSVWSSWKRVFVSLLLQGES